MSVILTVGGIILATIAVYSLAKTIKDNTPVSMPETLKTELTETDKEKALQSADIIKDVFGEKPIEKFDEMSTAEKIAALESIAGSLIELYGLEDTKFEMVNISDINTWGYYRHDEDKLYVNISLLMMDPNEFKKVFKEGAREVVLRETISTIVHELRHAVQHKAISLDSDDYWNTTEQTRIEWAHNFANYIPYEVDPVGYKNQIVERDANTYADEVMKGVFGDEKDA